MNAEQKNGLAVEQPLAETNQIPDSLCGTTASRDEKVDRAEYEAVLLGVITQADRFRDQIGHLTRQVSGRPELATTWRDQIAWRQADLLELEALLREHGVRTYQVKGNRYRPRYQMGVEQIPTSDEDAVGKVVERLRRGYRRGERVIRKELVAVSVTAPSQTLDMGNEQCQTYL